MTPAYAVIHLLFCLHGQLLAASLSSLLSSLDVHEDVFSLGHLSSLVALSSVDWLRLKLGGR